MYFRATLFVIKGRFILLEDKIWSISCLLCLWVLCLHLDKALLSCKLEVEKTQILVQKNLVLA